MTLQPLQEWVGTRLGPQAQRLARVGPVACTSHTAATVEMQLELARLGTVESAATVTSTAETAAPRSAGLADSVATLHLLPVSVGHQRTQPVETEGHSPRWPVSVESAQRLPGLVVHLL